MLRCRKNGVARYSGDLPGVRAGHVDGVLWPPGFRDSVIRRTNEALGTSSDAVGKSRSWCFAQVGPVLPIRWAEGPRATSSDSLVPVTPCAPPATPSQRSRWSQCGLRCVGRTNGRIHYIQSLKDMIRPASAPRGVISVPTDGCGSTPGQTPALRITQQNRPASRTRHSGHRVGFRSGSLKAGGRHSSILPSQIFPGHACTCG